MAMNAYRNYNIKKGGLSKNLEKLSSGYKINRAGDDAAGLAISEKMRSQITGLSAAQKNVKDGISLVKVAEGAMQELEDMLNRMDYLAVQSANGTYQDDLDRENLQKEVVHIKEEIDRIALSTNFNGIKLLDGSLNGRGEDLVIPGKPGTPFIPGTPPTPPTPGTPGKPGTPGTPTIPAKPAVPAVPAKKTSFEIGLTGVTSGESDADIVVTLGDRQETITGAFAAGAALSAADLASKISAAFGPDQTISGQAFTLTTKNLGVVLGHIAGGAAGGAGGFGKPGF